MMIIDHPRFLWPGIWYKRNRKIGFALGFYCAESINIEICLQNCWYNFKANWLIIFYQKDPKKQPNQDAKKHKKIILHIKKSNLVSKLKVLHNQWFLVSTIRSITKPKNLTKLQNIPRQSGQVKTLAKKTTGFAKANRPLISFTLIFQNLFSSSKNFLLGNTKSWDEGTHGTKKGSLKETFGSLLDLV